MNYDTGKKMDKSQKDCAKQKKLDIKIVHYVILFI